MNRRSAIKNLAIVAGGILILPSCLQDQKKGKASIKLTKLDLDIDQENLLAEIAETIIPQTDTPGAKSLKLHLFAMKMVNDCYEKEDQEKFVKGLKALQENAKEKFDKPFEALSKKEKEQLLVSIEQSKDEKDNEVHFYNIMKYRTIQGYMNSKYVMTNLVKYELVPGRYNGYFPVKA